MSSDAPPSFGSGSVPEKAFILNAAIADFQVPAASGGNATVTYAASGLPTGLVFDATGTDATGCSGTEAREICGTPSVAGTGTITITAQDGDTNMGPGRPRHPVVRLQRGGGHRADVLRLRHRQDLSAAGAITDFVVPAASGGNGTLAYAAANLPSGLVFDATGTDTPGCPGTEAREVCGTPDAATAGAVTVTITATDLDTNTAPTDSASLTFTVTVTAGASLASSPSPLTEANPERRVPRRDADRRDLRQRRLRVELPAGHGADHRRPLNRQRVRRRVRLDDGHADAGHRRRLRLQRGVHGGGDGAGGRATPRPGNIATGTLPVTPTPPSVLVSRRSLSLNEDPGAGSADQGTYTLGVERGPHRLHGRRGVSVASGNPT